MHDECRDKKEVYILMGLSHLEFRSKTIRIAAHEIRRLYIEKNVFWLHYYDYGSEPVGSCSDYFHFILLWTIGLCDCAMTGFRSGRKLNGETGMSSAAIFGGWCLWYLHELMFYWACCGTGMWFIAKG